MSDKFADIGNSVSWLHQQSEQQDIVRVCFYGDLLLGIADLILFTGG